MTVGTDLPFDRMVRLVDRWAAESGRRDVFAQIGETSWHPRHIGHAKFLEPNEFVRRLTSASAVVSHAGMGTILTALRHEKPILVMPRRASLGEQGNDHQLATARQLLDMGRIAVAFDEESLWAQLHDLDRLAPKARIGDFADADLLGDIRNFIFSGQSPR